MGKLASQPEYTIHHFSHPHPLQLFNYQPQQTIHLASCSCCKLKITGWVYTCTPCNYFLHISCSQMPQKISHPCHQIHALSLLSNPIYPEGIFNCDACGMQGNGFSYHCGACNIDLHTFCATKPMLVSHQSHYHQLNLTFSPPYQNKAFSCDICKNIGSKVWLYRCNLCEFDAHIGCATTKPIAPIQQAQVQQYQTPPPNAFIQYQVPGTQLAMAPPMQNYVAHNSMNNANLGAFSSAGPVGSGQGSFNQVVQDLNQTLMQGLLNAVGSGGGGGGGGSDGGGSVGGGGGSDGGNDGGGGGGDGGLFFNVDFSGINLAGQGGFDFSS